jgi:hypothetical protein
LDPIHKLWLPKIQLAAVDDDDEDEMVGIGKVGGEVRGGGGRGGGYGSVPASSLVTKSGAANSAGKHTNLQKQQQIRRHQEQQQKQQEQQQRQQRDVQALANRIAAEPFATPDISGDWNTRSPRKSTKKSSYMGTV